MSSPQSLLDEPIVSFKARAVDFIEKFNSSPPTKRYIFGINFYTDELIAHFEVNGIIDEKTGTHFYRGIKIFQLKEIPQDSLILVASGGATQTILARLAKENYTALDYYAFQKFHKKLSEPRFNENFPQEYCEFSYKFSFLYSRLADKESQNQFRSVINFRYTGNIHYMSGFKNKAEDQYFEKFLITNKPITNFIDVGSYDGFTSQQFARKFPDFSEINIFEPESSNFEFCQNRFRNDKRIKLHNVCLSSQYGNATFTSSGSTSKIDKEVVGGDIAVRPLDSYKSIVSGNTYIKVDIEGEELNFLRGAEEVIKEKTPFLGIAVYHNPAHLWKIADEVFKLNGDYSLYFRHYTETLYESIMFFIPTS